MKVLLDSHAVYWWTIASERLSSKARALIEEQTNAIFVSAASFYELNKGISLTISRIHGKRRRASKISSSPFIGSDETNCLTNLPRALILLAQHATRP